jgi:hypothetical protein
MPERPPANCDIHAARPMLKRDGGSECGLARDGGV